MCIEWSHMQVEIEQFFWEYCYLQSCYVRENEKTQYFSHVRSDSVTLMYWLMEREMLDAALRVICLGVVIFC